MIAGWMMRPIIKALFSLFDAVKDLDTRLKWQENPKTEGQCGRHDMVWEDVDLCAAGLREMRDQRLQPHAESCHCPTCRISKVHEVNHCPGCPFMERKWGSGPADCFHPDAPEPPHAPNSGNVEKIDTPPDWCPLRKQPIIVKLVVKDCPECAEMPNREDAEGTVICSTCGHSHIFGYKVPQLKLKGVETDCPDCIGGGLGSDCQRCNGTGKVEVL